MNRIIFSDVNYEYLAQLRLFFFISIIAFIVIGAVLFFLRKKKSKIITYLCIGGLVSCIFVGVYSTVIFDNVLSEGIHSYYSVSIIPRNKLSDEDILDATNILSTELTGEKENELLALQLTANNTFEQHTFQDIYLDFLNNEKLSMVSLDHAAKTKLTILQGFTKDDLVMNRKSGSLYWKNEYQDLIDQHLQTLDDNMDDKQVVDQTVIGMTYGLPLVQPMKIMMKTNEKPIQFAIVFGQFPNKDNDKILMISYFENNEPVVKKIKINNFNDSEIKKLTIGTKILMDDNFMNLIKEE